MTDPLETCRLWDCFCPTSAWEHLIAMIELSVYGDESGEHANARYYVLSGCIATPEVWTSFNIEWRALLAEAGVPELHAKFLFNNFQSSKNPYLAMTRERRRTLINGLLQVIRGHTVVPLTVALDVKAFNALSPDERRWLTGAGLQTKVRLHAIDKEDPTNPVSRITFRRKFTASGASTRPYRAALELFLGRVSLATPSYAHLHMIFDRHTALESGAIQAFNAQWRGRAAPGGGEFVSILYADSSAEPGLQAADLYAYLCGKHGESIGGDTKFVMEQLKPTVYLANEAYLRQTLEASRVELQWELRGSTASLPKDQLEAYREGEHDPRGQE